MGTEARPVYQINMPSQESSRCFQLSTAKMMEELARKSLLRRCKNWDLYQCIRFRSQEMLLTTDYELYMSRWRRTGSSYRLNQEEGEVKCP